MYLCKLCGQWYLCCRRSRNHFTGVGLLEGTTPKLWYMFLRTKLEKMGFQVDENDPCLFTKPGCIFVNYVNNGTFVAKDQETISQVLACLREQRLDFDEMGSLMDYLGVHVGECDTPDSIELTHLTKRIIEVLGLKTANSISTPAEKGLGLCVEEEPAIGNFNCQPVIGMAMFLCNNTCLDSAMAVHQYAWFISNPKRSHEVALKHIGRYLVGTSNRGLIIRPRTNLKVDCYIDADFAGVLNMEDVNDPRSVQSQTGFLLTLREVPILWKSKLQPLIALSTMGAEYSLIDYFTKSPTSESSVTYSRRSIKYRSTQSVQH
jgi:hypothetical protein